MLFMHLRRQKGAPPRMVDVGALLDELREKRFDFDLTQREQVNNFLDNPDGCNNGEIFMYSSAMLTCVIIVCLQQYLSTKDPAGRGPIVFGTTVATPSAFYTPVFAGLLGACVDMKQSMEEMLLILMLCLEPLVLLRLAMLVRDALREGVDTRTFPLPLTRRLLVVLQFTTEVCGGF